MENLELIQRVVRVEDSLVSNVLLELRLLIVQQLLDSSKSAEEKSVEPNNAGCNDVSYNVNASNLCLLRFVEL